jgi:hypothetical protein
MSVLGSLATIRKRSCGPAPLASRKEPGRTRERTHYTLTESEEEALRAWMGEPTGFSRIQMEPAWRLLAADLVGEEAVLESLRGLREQIADLFARLDVAEAMASTIPHPERYLLLNHRLARGIVRAHADWLEEVERELGSRRATSDARRRAEPRRPSESRLERGADPARTSS